MDEALIRVVARRDAQIHVDARVAFFRHALGAPETVCESEVESREARIGDGAVENWSLVQRRPRQSAFDAGGP